MKSRKKAEIRSSAAEYLTFITASGEGGVEAVYADENVWLTQKMMGVLYDVETNTVNEHLKKIYTDCELTEDATIRNFRIVRAEGSRQVERDIQHYNLKAIIAVGYAEFEKYRIMQDRLFKSDFDRFIAETEGAGE